MSFPRRAGDSALLERRDLELIDPENLGRLCLGASLAIYCDSAVSL